MDFKAFTLKVMEIIKGTLIGKVVLALITGGLSLLGAAPYFDKYISAALNEYLSIEASDPSPPIGVCMIVVAILLSIWERKNQIAIEKANTSSSKASKPILELCHRGISVKEIEPQKIFFDIPYCSGKNANAYNVKLENAIITPLESGLIYISDFSDTFPENINLSYETGKSMHYSLHPLSLKHALSSYIVIKGVYSDNNNNTYSVLDIFKFSELTNSWVRTLGNEDLKVRKFVQDTTKLA